jgi:hypothetical protein
MKDSFYNRIILAGVAIQIISRAPFIFHAIHFFTLFIFHAIYLSHTAPPWLS